MSFFKKLNNLNTNRNFVSLGNKRFIQLGLDLDGEAIADEYGFSVSMNAAGDRVAIGGPLNSVGGTKSAAGHVRVFSWNGTAWAQLGTDIDGEVTSDNFGNSVSMNAAGDRVAIGAPGSDIGGARTDAGRVQIFSWNGTSWTQLGGNIDGEAASDAFGASVSMNAAGNRVAIGGPSNDVGGTKVNGGHVRVFSWNGTAWTQLGVDIDAEAAGDQYGSSVSMNAVGDRVAIGGPWNSVGGTKTAAGHVRILSFNGTAWTQLGTDIDGEFSSDFFGEAVSMNAVGDRVAIGAPFSDANSRADSGRVRIFSWNGTSWTQLGGNIDGERAGDQYGSSVSMNAAGDKIAIGGPFNNGNGNSSKADTGHVRIFSWNGTAWEQLGVDIDGEALEDQSGCSVSMNAAGDRVVIGARYNKASGASARGHVRIYYDYITSGPIRQTEVSKLAQNINGEAASDASGYSVSINAVGDRVAIGAIYNNGPGSYRGHVRVYSWNNTTWTQLGVDIDGEADSDNSGWSVSMNAVGDRIAIGAPKNNSTGGAVFLVGHVRVYSWNGTAWTQLGTDIDGEANNDMFGAEVSMNAAGDRVAIGGYSNDVGGTKVDGGHARVYRWTGTAWTQLGVDIDAEAAGDTYALSVSINAAGDRVAIGGPLNDVGGTKANAGHVRVFSFGTSWTQLGVDIDGEVAGDRFGSSVSMNAAGDRVAIGAPLNNAGGLTDAGRVYVYSWNGTAWTQLGANIDGEAASDNFGAEVSMNAAGDRVAIGAPFNNAGGRADAGRARVYSWNGTSWTQLGGNIDGELAGENFGEAVSMNAVGDRVAIGAPYNDANGTDAGRVGIFQIGFLQ